MTESVRLIPTEEYNRLMLVEELLQKTEVKLQIAVKVLRLLNNDVSNKALKEIEEIKND